MVSSNKEVTFISEQEGNSLNIYKLQVTEQDSNSINFYVTEQGGNSMKFYVTGNRKGDKCDNFSVTGNITGKELYELCDM
ncbi:hypothetical protein DPMN_127870 [Dreissena polymorpha]|uniref:Uncharacterized protein n=1 Tax=Dreissena polymorpha TaxID=45954 RepID=A0A9D4JVU9_DREPO|nr:hypothetical protein DPMN_127870 [Dreissena polymorpha]